MLIERKEILNEDKSIGYIECIYESGNILHTIYFPKDARLYIAFNRGHMYSYANITEDVYNNFENAESQGKYFHKYIRNKDEYPTRREYTLYPREVEELKQIVENNKKEEENDE